MKSTNSKKKLIGCPECDGQLAIWYEMSIEYSRKIDPKNGNIMSRITKSDIQTTDIHGIKCTVCEWSESANNFSDEAQEISEMLNLEHVDFN